MTERLSAFATYLKDLSAQLRTGKAAEGAYRPALKELLQSLVPGITATNEPKRAACGAPDYAVSKTTPHGRYTIGYVEAKDIGTDLAAIESDSRRATPGTDNGKQLKRYYPLGNLLLTDYLEFRWYVDGECRSCARLGHLGSDGRVVREGKGELEVHELLTAFLKREPAEISKPKDLAEQMARLTHMVRDIIVRTFATGSESATLRDLHKAFETTLIPNLPIDQFADMFAQTLAYGLFAACCNHRGPGPFERIGAASEIPKTNPFLRRLFGVITGTELDDEPFAGFVDDLAQLLAHTDIDLVLEDFGKRTRREDPIVHFYETFLAAYDPKLREARGVYYTPEPVVSYIVRSVDHLVKERFDCPDGLADTSIVEYEREEGEESRKTVKVTSPRVLILDPACGTGTFLYMVVDHIREQFMNRGDIGNWADYVRQYLLPRLFGFELLMAPYAIAHLNLGMQLDGLDLPSKELQDKMACNFTAEEKDRLRVYLTNTFEGIERRVPDLFGVYRIISEEANSAREIKREMPILVVIGNPPYSANSANRSRETVDKGPGEGYISGWSVTSDGKATPMVKKVRQTKLKQYVAIDQPTLIGRLLMDYYISDGRFLSEQGEANPKMLQDDYVKFIRFGQWRIEQSGEGILAFITNHGYLDNPTFRGMRQQLMKAFSEIYILDLHGNKRKKERCPDGSKDENVFDIQQGVAIGIFVKEPGKEGPARVYHADLWGVRETADRQGGKYPWLFGHNIENTEWMELSPTSPFYLFVPQDTGVLEEYEQGWKLTDVMRVSSTGIKTHRDELVYDFNANDLRKRISDFLNPTESDEVIRQRYFSGQYSGRYFQGDNRDWKLSDKRVALRNDRRWPDSVKPCLYRPFDTRYVLYHPDAVDFPRPEVMRHMLAGRNIALIATRQTTDRWDVLVAGTLVGHKSCAAQDINTIFPLYLYPDPKTNGDLFSNGLARHPNLSPEFVADMENRLGLKFIRDGKGDLTDTFGPEDVLAYIYAIFHSPTYRTRYAEFLKIDFPRIPLTSNLDLFRRLVALGSDLIALHLMESPELRKLITRYPEPGDHLVEPGHPRYLAAGEPEPGTGNRLQQGRVYINKGDPSRGKQGQHFEGVPKEVWEFHVGGYRVCEKWLKDRRGRSLTLDDRNHYRKIVVALSETLHLMGVVDAAISSWPLG